MSRSADVQLMNAAESALIKALTDASIVDLMDATGTLHLRGTPLTCLFRAAALRFARTVHAFDTCVGERGLSQGSAWLMSRMAAGISISGQEHVPAYGPLIILANHPGMTDTVALFTSLASRDDLLIFAADRPFLRALPHVANRLILVSDRQGGRIAAIRTAARHLHDGGSLLTFPAGEIEPDPAIVGPHSAAAALQDWNNSYAFFARTVPHTRILPALVSHVISEKARTHPLTQLPRSARDKEKLAAALQVTFARYRDQVPRVAFGESTDARAVSGRALVPFIAAQMRNLIYAHADCSVSGASC